MEPKLEISPDFTIDDIHKIREYHHEITKNMTPEEFHSFYRAGTERGLKRIAEIREEKKKEKEFK